MKPKINKISIISSLIILILLAVPVAYLYYFADLQNNRFSRELVQRHAAPEFQENSRIFDQRIVLRKDKSFTINKSRLVFKGYKDNLIRLDVYMLELDPESAYPFYFSKADALGGITVGDSQFKLLKVNHHALQLKIIDLFQT